MATNFITKKAVKKRSGGRCERCGTREELHVHHLTYERYGNEFESDLLCLCLKCHGAEHPHHTFRTLAEQAKIAKRRKRRGGLKQMIEDTLRGARRRIRREQAIRQNKAEARRLG